MRGAAFSVFSAPPADELDEAPSEPEPEPEFESESESESESEEPVSEEEAPVPVLVAVLRVEEALEPEAEDYNRQ